MKAHTLLVAVVAATFAIGGCAAPEEPASESSAEEEAPAEETEGEVGCKELADEAVRISDESEQV